MKDNPEHHNESWWGGNYDDGDTDKHENSNADKKPKDENGAAHESDVPSYLDTTLLSDQILKYWSDFWSDILLILVAPIPPHLYHNMSCCKECFKGFPWQLPSDNWLLCECATPCMKLAPRKTNSVHRYGFLQHRKIFLAHMARRAFREMRSILTMSATCSHRRRKSCRWVSASQESTLKPNVREQIHKRRKSPVPGFAKFGEKKLASIGKLKDLPHTRVRRLAPHHKPCLPNGVGFQRFRTQWHV